MFGLVVDFLVKVLGYALPFTLRKAYPPPKLSELITIKLPSDTSGVEFWAGDLPYAKVWIEITNLSPFPVVMDRAFGHFYFGTQLAAFIYLKIETIKPSTSLRFPLHAEMSMRHVKYIKQVKSQNSHASVYFNAHFKCSVNDVFVQCNLETTHFRLSNFDLPSSQ